MRTLAYNAVSAHTHTIYTPHLLAYGRRERKWRKEGEGECYAHTLEEVHAHTRILLKLTVEICSHTGR